MTEDSSRFEPRPRLPAPRWRPARREQGSREEQPGSLRRRTVRGAGWMSGGSAAGQVLRLLGNLLLTRLLYPEAMGVMLVVNAIIMGLRMVSDLGITAQIVRSERTDARFLDTAWTFQVLRGAALALLCAGAAVPLARLYDEPLLERLLPVVALVLLIEGFNSTSLAELRRELAVRQTVLLELLSQAVALAVMCAWALLAPSVWALVAGTFTRAIVRLAASHTVLARHRPRPAWDRSAVTALLGFGSWMLLVTALTFAGNQANRLLTGMLVPMGVLGVFSVAVQVADLPNLLLLSMGGSVLFPALSRVRRDGLDLGSAYRRVRRPIVVAGGALAAGLFASGPPAIMLLWDERYRGAASMLAPLAAAVWLRLLAMPASNLVFAQGALRRLVAANGARLLGFLCLVPAGHAVHGLQGALWGFVGGEFLGWLVYQPSLSALGTRTLPGDAALSLLVAVSAAAGTAAALFVQRTSGSLLLAVLASGLVVLLAWIGPGVSVLRDVLGRRASRARPS